VGSCLLPSTNSSKVSFASLFRSIFLKIFSTRWKTKLSAATSPPPMLCVWTLTQRQIQVGEIWPENVLSLGCLHRAVTWPSLRSFYRLIVQSAASRRRWSCRLYWYRTAGMPLEGIQNNKIRSNVSSAGKTYTLASHQVHRDWWYSMQRWIPWNR